MTRSEIESKKAELQAALVELEASERRERDAEKERNRAEAIHHVTFEVKIQPAGTFSPLWDDSELLQVRIVPTFDDDKYDMGSWGRYGSSVLYMVSKKLKRVVGQDSGGTLWLNADYDKKYTTYDKNENSPWNHMQRKAGEAMQKFLDSL